MSKTTSTEQTPGQPSHGAVGWKTVSVFVSSTFDDMHAERDYLVKEVFPRLREWCEQRRLRLVDVDLRWGVTEADATNNKRVVDVCLRRIDDCRPFFICLLGQRYGWIPRRQDVAAETGGASPHIAGALGAASVTEKNKKKTGRHLEGRTWDEQPRLTTPLPAKPTGCLPIAGTCFVEPTRDGWSSQSTRSTGVMWADNGVSNVFHRQPRPSIIAS
jgi:hypothetical protein